MRTSALLAILALLLGATAQAHAHAYLDRADPRVGSTVGAAPRTLSLWFTENLEPAFSTVEVRNASGARVDQGRARLDGASRNVLHVALKPLPPGTYRVQWRVLSVDTHTTEGNFSFQVGQ
jgi:methionine-rich copper-binding protein CopC